MTQSRERRVFYLCLCVWQFAGTASTRADDRAAPVGAPASAGAASVGELVTPAGGLMTASPPSGRDRDLLRLGEHFYASGQFYRAIGAFEELALFTDDAVLHLHADLRVAMSYHHGLQIREAVAAYDVVAPRVAGDPALRGYVHLLRILARAEGQWRGLAPAALADLTAELAGLERDDGAPYQVLAGYQLARLELGRGLRDEARAAYTRDFARCRSHPVDDCAVLARLVEPLGARPPRHRSPVLGAALSAAVPGLGSLYDGRAFDAVYYFGLTVGAGLLSLDAHRGDRSFGDQPVGFYVLGALAATFYVSSIAQGWVGALRFNEVEAYEYGRAILRTTEVPLPLEHLAPIDAAAVR